MSFQERTHMWKVAGKYSALGLEMGIGVAMGAGGGNWLDERFGTKPWGLAVGFVIGIGAACTSAMRVVRQARRDM